MTIEVLHRCRLTSRGIYIFTTKHLLYRYKYHLQVCHQRAMVYIPNVQLKLLRPRDCITSMTLCPTRNAWSNFMTTSLFFAIQWKILYEDLSTPYHPSVHLSTEATHQSKWNEQSYQPLSVGLHQATNYHPHPSRPSSS